MVMYTNPTYAYGKMMTLKKLTLTAVLMCCLGASLANAQRLAALPNDSRFDTPITLTTALGGESLGAIITAIANSVGLTPVLEDVPDELVNYEIIDPKPFRQIWNLVLSLNGLDYQLLPNDIIVVGIPESIGTVGERGFAAGEDVPVETRFYFTRFVEPGQIEERLNTLLSNIDTDDLLVLEDFLRATADANPQLEQAPAADGTDDGDAAQPAPQIFFPATPFPAPAAEPAEPEGWQEDDSAPVVMLAGDASAFYAQATDTTMQATAAEEPTLVERLISVRVDNDVLVVTAPEGIIDQLERIITALDAPSQRPAAPDPIVRRSYRLSNARAEELAPTLLEALTGVRPAGADTNNNVSIRRESLGGARSAVTTSGGSDGSDIQLTTTTSTNNGGSVLTTAEAINIAADTRTNRLIITAPESVQTEVASLLEELDTPQRQVSIQVRIQEMNVEVSRQLGINWNGGVGNFSTTFVDTGLNFVFDAQRALSGFNIGAVLDTLERQNVTRSVDDSTVLVLDNEEGRIQSGGTIFITLVGGSIAVERTIPYGLQITFLPQITGDGRINMQVDARIETVLSDTSDPNFLNIGSRNVTSSITLAPGQTVLLGGLLQNSVTEAQTGIPLLQDIPVIGSLFRNTSETTTQNDLVLVVTADVIE